MQKIIKPWGFEYNFKSHKAQCSFPSYTSIPLRNVIWKIQSKTPTAALTNNVSTDWPHQRERVGQNQTNPTFHSTFPSHKITFYKTHFSPSQLLYYCYVTYRKHLHTFIYVFCMFSLCSSGLSKTSKQVFTAIPHSLIPWISARFSHSSETELRGSTSVKGNNGLNIQPWSAGATVTEKVRNNFLQRVL